MKASYVGAINLSVKISLTLHVRRGNPDKISENKLSYKAIKRRVKNMDNELGKTIRIALWMSRFSLNG
jgi:hypothetical protein